MSLFFELDHATGNLFLGHEETRERLVVSTGGSPLTPIIDGQTDAGRFLEAEESPSGASMRWEFPAALGIDGFVFHIEKNSSRDALDLWCEFRTSRDIQLNTINLLPTSSLLNLYDAVNFRNRHHTANTWPELSLGSGLRTTTYSDDWQFAPHPTALLLRKNDLSIFVGALDVQAAFGMSLEAKSYKVVE